MTSNFHQYVRKYDKWQWDASENYVISNTCEDVLHFLNQNKLVIDKKILKKMQENTS